MTGIFLGKTSKSPEGEMTSPMALEAAMTSPLAPEVTAMSTPLGRMVAAMSTPLGRMVTAMSTPLAPEVTAMTFPLALEEVTPTVGDSFRRARVDDGAYRSTTSSHRRLRWLRTGSLCHPWRWQT